jgi:hypothetical protein
MTCSIPTGKKSGLSIYTLWCISVFISCISSVHMHMLYTCIYVIYAVTYVFYYFVVWPRYDENITFTVHVCVIVVFFTLVSGLHAFKSWSLLPACLPVSACLFVFIFQPLNQTHNLLITAHLMFLVYSLSFWSLYLWEIPAGVLN